MICPTREAKYFCGEDWTGQFTKAVLICPSGWVASTAAMTSLLDQFVGGRQEPGRVPLPIIAGIGTTNSPADDLKRVR